MDNEFPGPSTAKRQCFDEKKPLKELEMLQVVYDSDSDEPFVDSKFELSENNSEHIMSDESDGDEKFLPFDADGNAQDDTADNTITWSNNSNLKIIPFLGNNELLQNVAEQDPYNFFKLVITDDFLQHIVEETNTYAEEVFLSSKTTEKSRITNWKLLSLEEFKVFLGLWLHMGHIEMNRIQDYWKTDELYNISCFQRHMSRNRFLLILRCLHFSKNPQREDANCRDRIHKIRFVQDYLNSRMNEIYYPDKNLCVDESMVLWRGRLSFRQYIKNKKHKFGIKLYILSEPNGLVLNVRSYTGAESDMSGKGHASNVVLVLVEHYLGKGHSLFMDNFYNSFSLSQDLLAKNTYTTGTLRKNHKDNPKEVIAAKLDRGETIAKHREGVVVGKWRDKREVYFISSEFGDTLVPAENRRGQVIEKPKAIIMYNKNMSGIDRQDQMLSYYASDRKNIRWYKKLFMHLFSIMLLNSYHLYSKFSTQTKVTYYEFRHIIIKKLLSEKEAQATTQIQRPSNNHYPTKLPKGSNGRQMRKRCKICYSNNQLRKDTPYICSTCPDSPGFCLEECFQQYHNNKN